MIRMVLCALLSASISACATVDSGVRDVNCTGEYGSNINLHSKRDLIKVKSVRVDKNGDLWIKPSNTLNTHFFGGWKSPSLLHNYQCIGEDYGLRSSAI